MKGRGQARPEPPGRDDKRQQWRHFTVTISTCPSVAASGSTQPGGGRQRTALSWRDKEGRGTRCAHRSWTYSITTLIKVASVKVLLFQGLLEGLLRVQGPLSVC